MEAEHKIQNCLLSESEESAHWDQNCPKPFHIYWLGFLPWASPGHLRAYWGQEPQHSEFCVRNHFLRVPPRFLVTI